MMKRNRLILLLYLCVQVATLAAVGYHMQRIDSRDGLSNSAVLSMYQDEKGFMWIGTYNGLNRYDGKFIESFGLDESINNVQSSNIIHDIQGAGENCLWLSTYIGFTKFSINQNKVVEHYPKYGYPYNLASNGNKLTCLVAKRGFISVYNSSKKVFEDIASPDIDPTTVISTFIDQNNELWIFTNVNRVWKASVLPGDQKNRTVLEIVEVPLITEPIVAAFEENGLIFYVSKSGELYSFDIDRNRNNYIRNIQSIMNQYGVLSAIISYHDDIWISFKGSGVLKLVTKNKYDEEVLDMSSGVFCLHKDIKQDIMWIGSDGQGIVMYSNKTSIFNTIRSEALPFQIKKPIRAIFTDKFNTLWIGTKGDGLIRIKDYDGVDDRNVPEANVQHFTTANGLSNNQIFAIVSSKFHNINWLGTEGPELSYFSYSDQKIHSLINPTNTVIRAVHSLIEENDSTLWLATSTYGLYKVVYSKKGNALVVDNIRTYIFNRNKKLVNDLFSMYRDNTGYLWLGSRGDGVIHFNTKDETYRFITSGKQFNSPVDDILSNCKSKNSVFYFGSCAGLMKLSEEGGNMRLVEIPNRNRSGMREMIHGMQEDESGCLWMSTNRGLEKYNPTNNVFHKYIKNTGLNVIEFSDNADYKCPFSNRIFFGGVDGIVWIEQNIPDYKAISPDVQFTALKINGVKQNLSGFLKQNKQGRYIELGSHQNTFSVSFIAIDFIRGVNIEYLYKLEGYNNEWLSADDLNEARFNSLTPGKYNLKVKYKYDVFDTESEFYSLPIVILPPWYFSPLAWMVYLVLLISLAIYLIRVFERKMQKKRQAFSQLIIERNKEELYDAKMKFFTNITHEFLTPLTLIQGPCDRILAYDNADVYVKKYASLLRVNIERLQLLIHEIINFSKREEFGDNNCRIEKVKLSEITKSINIAFSETIERNNLDFEIDINDDLDWNTDISCLNKILMNLISNAFKYTPTGGKIKVTLRVEDNELLIRVYNTGKGIKKEELMRVFDRFRILDNMEKNAYMDFSSRNGLGLAICYSMIQQLRGAVDVKSEVDGYTEFIVSLPFLEVSETDATSEQSAEEHLVEHDFEPNASQSNVFLNRKKILIVDDNKEIVWMVAELMHDKYDIIKAYNAQEALDILDNELPELIVADLMMPGELDGSDLVKRLKDNRFTTHIPVIIVSAKNSMEDQIAGLESGADFYLTKPFNLSYLRTTIEKLIEKKSALKDFYNSPLSALELKSGQIMHHEDQVLLMQVKQIIDKNIGKGELRPDFIAEQLKMSPQSFYRKLKSISSLSPSDFIKKYRFSLAAKLLLSSNMSVQEVIYKIGINNRSYFYREFFKIYNATPKEYRLLNDVDEE
jgi:signal transduction histidine kinase/DNA-binding response OmpR family regulator/ligand-binding sensor domain-containing protein